MEKKLANMERALKARLRRAEILRTERDAARDEAAAATAALVSAQRECNRLLCQLDRGGAAVGGPEARRPAPRVKVERDAR
jgi:hypothetical protein